MRTEPLVTSAQSDLLARVERLRSRMGVGEVRIGDVVAGDPQFVRRLREGTVSLRKAQAVEIKLIELERQAQPVDRPA